MQDAKRFRAQAELCLQIARLMTDSTAAADLRAKAAEHSACAIALENQSDENREEVADFEVFFTYAPRREK